MGHLPLRMAVGSAVNRLEAVLDSLHPAPSVTPVDLEALIEHAAAGGPVSPDIVPESALDDIEAHVRQEAREQGVEDPDRVHDGDLAFARTCYVLCRLVRPSNVVETGVANGVSSSFVLQALAVNKHGRLWSVDLPPHGVAKSAVGRFVPDELRSRWDLRLGPSKRVLAPLLDELGGIGMFVHDSRHSYRNVRRELRTVEPHLTRPAAVVVDDAERHSAFFDWVARANPAVSGVIAPSQKVGMIGAAVLL